MNVQDTNGIRELTTAELNEVTGGGSIIGDAIRAALDYYVLSNDLIIDFCGNTDPHLA